MTQPNALFDVSGKTALVTGGSRGIGLMIARGLVQAGASVIVSSRKSEEVNETARQLAELGACQAIPADISTPEGASELARATRELFPTLDILVNNAGAIWGAPRSSRACHWDASADPTTWRASCSSSPRAPAPT
jgi:NAD(P)-dependent dehydrogenase (short-subunit alcohol dehydrogenase family)